MADKDFDYGLPPPGVFGKDPELHLRGDVWYSYTDLQGSIHTKRYLCWGDYKEVGDSNLVLDVTRLYTAGSRVDAVDIGKRKLLHGGRYDEERNPT